MAAGQAIEAIAKNVKKWCPPEEPPDDTDGGQTSPTPDSDEWMTFNSFDIKQVNPLNLFP